MKATLATLACLLTVGFLSAAEVTGNNTAVVIRKNVVESDTHYQFLCVPVDGLDIANGTTTKIKLGTLIPANTVKAGTTLILVGGDDSGATYTSNGTEWEEGAAEVELDGGQIFWLRSPEEESQPAAAMSLSRTTPVVTYSGEEPKTVIFCGQDRGDYVKDNGILNEVKPMCNASSKAVQLKDVVNAPAKRDTILTLKNKTSEYVQYIYNGTYWVGPASANCNNVEIAPGEAFYYLKRGNN